MTSLHVAKRHLGNWGANTRIAKACGVSNMTVTRWMARGCLPISDVVGRTNYAAIIEGLTEGAVTRGQLHADIFRLCGSQSAAA